MRVDVCSLSFSRSFTLGPPPPLRLHPLRRPFCAWCEKFTIVCRGTAIAPLHRAAIKSFLGIATEAGVDVQEVEVAAFFSCLALRRMSRNYNYQNYETLCVFYYDLSGRYIEKDSFLFTANYNNDNFEFIYNNSTIVLYLYRHY